MDFVDSTQPFDGALDRPSQNIDNTIFLHNSWVAMTEVEDLEVVDQDFQPM